MPCICHGAITGDDFLDSIINTPEFKKVNKMLKEAASSINAIAIPMETYVQSYHDAWMHAFKHHLRGCDGK